MTPTPAVSAKEKAREIVERHRKRLADPHNYSVLARSEHEYLIDQIAALSTEGEAEPVAWPLPADKELPPITDRGFAGQIMDVAWPHYGGNHQTAEFWNDFGEGVRFALHYASPPSAPAGVKVKPLEWRMAKPDGENQTAYADSIVGEYTAFAFRSLSPTRHMVFGWQRRSADEGRAGSFDEAKAAAQADYDQRIRSSLQPDTQAPAASAPAGDIQELASASVRPEPSSVEPRS